MTFEASMYSVLAADTSIGALVGDAIFPFERVPQAQALPYIAYRRLYGAPTFSFSGAGGLKNIRMQIDVFASSYESAKDLAEAVKSVMNASFKIGHYWDMDLSEHEINAAKVTIDFSIWTT